MNRLKTKHDLTLSAMTANKKHLHKVQPESMIEIQNEPPMQLALDLISILGKYREVILVAKGNAISNAVTVANIITKSILRGNSRIDRVLVDSEFTGDMGQLLSTIEIKIKNPK